MGSLKGQAGDMRIFLLVIIALIVMSIVNGCCPCCECVEYKTLLDEFNRGKDVTTLVVNRNPNVAHLELIDGEYTGEFIRFLELDSVQEGPFFYKAYGDTLKVFIESSYCQKMIREKAKCFLVLNPDTLVKLKRVKKTDVWEKGPSIFVAHDFK